MTPYAVGDLFRITGYDQCGEFGVVVDIDTRKQNGLCFIGERQGPGMLGYWNTSIDDPMLSKLDLNRSVSRWLLCNRLLRYYSVVRS